jgi:hypothetical protein
MGGGGQGVIGRDRSGVDSAGSGSRPVVTVSPRLLIAAGGRLLLASDRSGQRFHLPAVQVGQDERIEDALHRAIRQISGLTAEALDFVGCLENLQSGDGAVSYELSLVFAGLLPRTPLMEQNTDVTIMSVAVAALPTLDLRPAPLMRMLSDWLHSQRPAWCGLSGPAVHPAAPGRS